MGISAEQAAHVQRTWAPVTADLTGLGTEFFVIFLNNHDGYQNMFSALKDIPVADLAADERTRNHATNILKELTQMINCCGNEDELQDLLTKNAAVHKARHLSQQHYDNLFADLLPFLQSKLGDMMDDGAVSSWTALAQHMSGSIAKGL